MGKKKKKKRKEERERGRERGGKHSPSGISRLSDLPGGKGEEEKKKGSSVLESGSSDGSDLVEIRGGGGGKKKKKEKNRGGRGGGRRPESGLHQGLGCWASSVRHAALPGEKKEGGEENRPARLVCLIGLAPVSVRRGEKREGEGGKRGEKR